MLACPLYDVVQWCSMSCCKHWCTVCKQLGSGRRVLLVGWMEIGFKATLGLGCALIWFASFSCEHLYTMRKLTSSSLLLPCVPQMDPKFLRNQRYAKKHNKAAE